MHQTDKNSAEMKLSDILPSYAIDRKIESKKIKRAIYAPISAGTDLVQRVDPNFYTTKIDEWEPPLLISEKYKFGYVLNPLCASRTIVHHLVKKPDINYKPKFIGLKTTKTRVKKSYKNVEKFTIVRHPFKKLVSGYRKQVLNANTIRKLSMLSQYEELKPQMSFKNFVQWLCKNRENKGAFDSHWAPHSHIFSGLPDGLSPSRFIKLENLQNGYKKFCEKNKIPYYKLPHLRSSKSLMHSGKEDTRDQYLNSLSTKSIECLKEIYSRDFQCFEYSYKI